MLALALILTAQAAEPQKFFTPEEERAVAAGMQCEKNYFDSIPTDERRRRGKSLIDESYKVCANEEAAVRTLLSSRFDAQATEKLIQLMRDSIRDQTLQYIER